MVVGRLSGARSAIFARILTFWHPKSQIFARPQGHVSQSNPKLAKYWKYIGDWAGSLSIGGIYGILMGCLTRSGHGMQQNLHGRAHLKENARMALNVAA